MRLNEYQNTKNAAARNDAQAANAAWFGSEAWRRPLS
jgi:hypothetical protein